MHAEICPVCNGTGRDTYNDYYRPPDTTTGCSYTITCGVCRGCNGKGWVEVSDR